MKKSIILFVLTAMWSLTANAQIKTVQALADKYSDRIGFSTTVIQGDIGMGAGGALNVHNIDISNVMKDIASIVVVASDIPNEEFSADVKGVIAAYDYSTIMSVSSGREMIKFLLRSLPSEGGKSPANEFVIVVLGYDENIIVSVVGNYKVKNISKLQNE